MKTGHKLTLLIILLLVADQALKIWVKTHMSLGETIMVIPTWFRLHFIENSGAAFGMRIDTPGAFDWGKLALTLFRVVLVGAIVWLIRHLLRKRAPKGVLVGFSLILAGAIGNIIDSVFYGLVFDYAPLMMGKVVDMFYFPLFRWEGVPRFLSFLTDGHGYFFGAVFNLADTYISVAVIYLLIFQYKFFNNPTDKVAK